MLDGSDATCDFISPRTYVSILPGVRVDGNKISDGNYIRGTTNGECKAIRIGSVRELDIERAVHIPCDISSDESIVVELVRKAPQQATLSKEGDSS